MLKKKGKDISRGIWLICAVLLVFGGILSLLTPGNVRPYLAFTFGLIMAAVGISCFLVYALMRSAPFGPEWILADGLVALSLCGQVAREAAIPFAMGAWLLFSGITKWICLVHLRRCKAEKWWWMAVPAAALMLLGLVSQYVFAASDLSGLFMGLAFLLEGAHFAFLWWFWPQIPSGEKEPS